MKKTALFTLLVLTLASGIHAQRSVPPRPTATAFRPVGELRVWTFLQGDSIIGTLTSRVDRTTEINGVEAVALDEQLKLDFVRVGGEYALDISGRHYVSMAGEYLGDRMKLSVAGQDGEISVERDGGRLRGETARAGREQPVDMGVAPGLAAIDNHMADQLELFLALRGLTEGEMIADSVFVPRDMVVAPVRGQVIGWTWQQLYKGVFDSVFVVRLEQPAPMELFINAGLALRKINIPTQDMRVYLDVIRRDAPSGPPPVTLMSLLKMTPLYVVLLLAGLIGVVLFAGGMIRRGKVWMGLAAGAALFVPVALIQLPLQEYLFTNLFQPRFKSDPSGWWWGLPAVFPTGIIQQALVVIGVYLVGRIRPAVKSSGAALGAAVGAGLGVVEACYLQTVVGDFDLFSWTMLQRVLFVFFHAAAGSLIGDALARRGGWVWAVIAITALANAVLRFLPVFMQIKRAEAGMVDIVSGVIVVGLMIWGVLAQKRAA